MEIRRLDNGIEVCQLTNRDYRLIRMDVRVKAGSRFQSFPGVAQTTAKMLLEGTLPHPDAQWSACMEALGAYADVFAERDFVRFSFHFPQEAVMQALPLLAEIFISPLFSDERLQIVRIQHKQQLSVQLQKSSFIAYRTFLSALFGQHSYGQFLSLEEMDGWTIALLRQFFEDCYVPESMRIFVAGNITETFWTCLNRCLGQWSRRSFRGVCPEMVLASTPQCCFVLRPDSVQSSICLGKVLPVRRGVREWMALQLSNRILGGYFGSRLMTEIRERSGLAYGISSHLLSRRHAGLLCITADIDAERIREALDKVRREVKKLSETRIGQDELDLVKNYEYGSLLRSFDGLFSVMERYMETDDAGLPPEEWKAYFSFIPTFDAETLQQTATTFLDPESFTEVVVGKEPYKP